MSPPNADAEQRKPQVIGTAKRGGNVQARVQTDLSGHGILRFVKSKIDPK